MVKANMVIFMSRVPDSALLEAQGGCFYCKRPLTPKAATADHLYPRSKGHTLAGNKVMACRQCNKKKGSRMPTAYEVDRARSIWVSLGVPGWEIG